MINSSRFYALGISKVNDTTEYQLLELQHQNNELTIESRCFSTEFDESFKARLNKDYPMILHIEGDNILNKQVENKVGYRSTLIFKANPDEFYFFEFHQDEKVFISVSRKENIDVFVQQISDINKYVVHLSFGPFVMANLIPFAKGYDHLLSSNYSIQLEQNEIIDFKNEKSSDQEFIINGDKFNQRELPLLASFFDYKYRNPSIEFDVGFLASNKEECKFKRWFKVAGIFTLAFFLVSLATSHYLTGFYMSVLSEKESLNVVSQENIKKLNDLKEEKLLKEKILQSSGINNKSFITKYISDIGNFVPNDIILDAIHVIPPIKKTRPNEKINFDINSVIVKGVSKNDKSFNDWLKKLEALPWVRKIDIESYLQETKTENSFTLEIKI